MSPAVTARRPRARRASAWWPLVGLLALGCAKTVRDDTSVRIVVTSDLTALDEITIEAVRLPDGSGAGPRRFPQPALPVGFVLLPRSTSAERFRITAVGLVNGTAVVSRAVESRFLAGNRASLALTLDSACEGMLCAVPAGQTCERGACVSIPTVAVREGEPSDGGTSDAAWDAASDDAASDAVPDVPAPQDVHDANAPDVAPMCSSDAAACTVGTLCLSATSLRTCALGAGGCPAVTTSQCGAGTLCMRSEPAACLDPNWAAWPMPNGAADVNAAIYTDNGDGTVTDDVTGLMWEKSPGATPYEWSAARTHCPQLRLGGHTDWRLPTLIELLSLVDYGVATPPVVRTAVFPTIEPGLYWTSTTSTSMNNSAWEVNFTNGNTNADSTTSPNPAICVR